MKLKINFNKKLLLKNILLSILVFSNISLIVALPTTIILNDQKYNQKLKITELKQYLYSYYNSINELYSSSIQAVGNKLGCHELRKIVQINYVNYLSNNEFKYNFLISIVYESFDPNFPNSSTSFKISIDYNSHIINYFELGNNLLLEKFGSPETTIADIELINYLEKDENKNLKMFYNSFYNKIDPTFNPTLYASDTGFQFLNFANTNNKFMNCTVNIAWKPKPDHSLVDILKLNCIYDIATKNYTIIGLISL